MDRLDNLVRRYDWGSPLDIPRFCGTEPDGGPVAELWMGAHPGAPSVIHRDGRTVPLHELISADPGRELGAEVVSRFGPQLPFLLKLISAAHPLSLQVHPDREHAQAAYAAQQRSGQPDGDYTDANHKPELVCALRDGFSALCGFRPVDDTLRLLTELAVPQLQELADVLAAPGADRAAALRAVVTGLLSPGAGGAARTIAADPVAVITALRQGCERVAGTSSPWAGNAAALAMVAATYPADRGVLVALLLNHRTLGAGEAMFVGAGIAHCYLSGFAVELMASSDNVLRAGLTSKRVHAAELLRVLDFRPGPPRLVSPEPDGAWMSYPVPVDDFRFSRLRLSSQPASLGDGLPQIILCTAGQAELAGASGTLRLAQGQSAYVPASDAAMTVTGTGELVRATAGVTMRNDLVAARLS